MIMAAIYSHKDRNVAVINWSGAYLHTHLSNDVDDNIIYILLEEKIANPRVMIDSKLYYQYVTINEKGIKHL